MHRPSHPGESRSDVDSWAVRHGSQRSVSLGQPWSRATAGVRTVLAEALVAGEGCDERYGPGAAPVPSGDTSPCAGEARTLDPEIVCPGRLRCLDRSSAALLTSIRHWWRYRRTWCSNSARAGQTRLLRGGPLGPTQPTVMGGRSWPGQATCRLEEAPSGTRHAPSDPGVIARNRPATIPATGPKAVLQVTARRHQLLLGFPRGEGDGPACSPRERGLRTVSSRRGSPSRAEAAPCPRTAGRGASRNHVTPIRVPCRPWPGPPTPQPGLCLGYLIQVRQSTYSN